MMINFRTLFRNLIILLILFATFQYFYFSQNKTFKLTNQLRTSISSFTSSSFSSSSQEKTESSVSQNNPKSQKQEQQQQQKSKVNQQNDPSSSLFYIIKSTRHPVKLLSNVIYNNGQNSSSSIKPPQQVKNELLKNPTITTLLTNKKEYTTVSKSPSLVKINENEGKSITSDGGRLVLLKDDNKSSTLTNESSVSVSMNSSSNILQTTINKKNVSYDDLPLCSSRPENLLGFVKVTLSAPSLNIISKINSDLTLGGHYRPNDCKARDKVAIIVPFRDREEHLRIFLYNIHPILQRQKIEYNIFIIEQGGSKDEPFNRAMLLNVGFTEAPKISKCDYDCYIFHDVDLIPENDKNLYSCPIQPRHMSVAIDKMNYRLPYRTIFGGVSAMRKEHFIKVNGFSNLFWGWGGEDDSMANRIAFKGLFISRPSPNVARYKMLKHKHQKLNNNRYKILKSEKKRFGNEGLTSLNYTIEQVIMEKLYISIRAKLHKLGE